MRFGVLAILGVVLAIALAVAIPMMRDGPEIEGAPVAAEEPGPTETFELRNMFDLVDGGLLAISATGSNIREVSLSVLNLSNERLRFHVPAGAFFASTDPAAQSMIATGGAQEFDLMPHQAITVSVQAACANLPLHIPNWQTDFTISRTPPRPELARVAAHLGNESYDVRQATIWIISDNADYGDLGILVTGASYGNAGGVRVIDPEDAVRAMQIVNAAGVDIRDRRIWRNRAMLLEATTDGDPRRWLESAG
jgi:hypothetical protein